MLRVAVVGVGHLGKEHARILATMPGVELVGVVDPNRAQAEAVAQRCGTQAFLRPDDVQFDAAVIAAPTIHHHAIATHLLRADVHLMIEKPITSTLDQARQLVELAEERQLVLQVGHVERFNPAFEELQNLPLCPRYLQAERCGGFTGRSTDVGVVLDLMIHDLDLVLALVNSSVRDVQAMGVAVLGGHEDVAQARLTFDNGCIADLTASRVHPHPSRRMQVWGVEGYVGVDYAKRSITMMQPGEMLRSGKIDSRRLDPATTTSLKAELFGRFVESVELDCNRTPRADQLTRELQEFVHCIRTGAAPRADGHAGCRAIEVASMVLDRVQAHVWEADAVGPNHLPQPRGLLFTPASREAAA